MRKLRNFLAAFVRNDGPKPARHSGHRLAENLRAVLGTSAASSSGGGGSAWINETAMDQAATATEADASRP